MDLLPFLNLMLLMSHLTPYFKQSPNWTRLRGDYPRLSRTYVDSSDLDLLAQIADRIARLQLDGLICIGGDGTMNGLQPLCDIIPTVLGRRRQSITT